MPFGNINVDTVTTSTTGGILGAGNASIMKNRLINGNFSISQYNGTSSVTPVDSAVVYVIDRWATYATAASKISYQQNAGSVTPPTGFTNYLGATSLSAYSVGSGDLFQLQQRIEGFNTADLGWGTASASSVTLSFWVRSSLTGTFGGSLRNSASNRSYPFSYTISAANTWEQKTITVAGDTSGTWVTNNGIGISITWGMGVGSTYTGTAGSWSGSNYASATGATSVVGTNGATFYITGVQLEVGSSATGFEYVNYQTSLANCQRYYEKSYNIATTPGTATAVGMVIYMGITDSAGNVIPTIRFAVNKRSDPTLTFFNSSTGASGTWVWDRSGASGTISMTQDGATGNGQLVTFANTGGAYTSTKIVGHWTASSEL